METTAKRPKGSPAGSDRFYAGIDAGSVSLNCIVINDKKEIVFESPYKRHLGKVEEGIYQLLRDLYLEFGKDRIRSVCFTGNHGKKLADRLDAFYEFETISQVLGAISLRPDVRTIISMGGQDTALLQIRHEKVIPFEPGMGNPLSPALKGWQLEYFNTNGPCASGTGSFIDQQAQRLATAIYEKKTDMSQDQVDKILG
jgi:activator of 2-hydroxyglutaryl-CoA dehydratase